MFHLVDSCTGLASENAYNAYHIVIYMQLSIYFQIVCGKQLDKIEFTP